MGGDSGWAVAGSVSNDLGRIEVEKLLEASADVRSVDRESSRW